MIESNERNSGLSDVDRQKYRIVNNVISAIPMTIYPLDYGPELDKWMAWARACDQPPRQCWIKPAQAASIIRWTIDHWARHQSKPALEKVAKEFDYGLRREYFAGICYGIELRIQPYRIMASR